MNLEISMLTQHVWKTYVQRDPLFVFYFKLRLLNKSLNKQTWHNDISLRNLIKHFEHI